MKSIIIINKDQVSSVNFDEVLEDNVNTLSYNLDGTKTFVKFTGDTPSFVTNETIYSLSEFHEFTSDYNNGWCVDPELEEEI
tara:strand:- start:288 stop:533 length:246 start_codon:yes stop_codon:yes gene_type:complete